MTGRGSPSRFLTAVLHNGVGRYVRQLQRLQLLFSPTAADARGARYGRRHRPTAGMGRGEPGDPLSGRTGLPLGLSA